MDAHTIAEQFERNRPDLLGFLTRLVMRPAVAEELTQATALRALEAAARAPVDVPGFRRWIFTIGSRLAVDHLRQHGTWKETLLLDSRPVAESLPDFMDQAMALRHTPELAAIAREHLAVCFGCALRNLAPHKAATLLLREVYGFTFDETAEILEVRPAQAKNWLQEARQTLDRRYAATCALIHKQGPCHQCVELDGFFNGAARNPLEGSSRQLDARLRVLQDLKARPLGPWHRLLVRLLEDLTKSSR